MLLSEFDFCISMPSCALSLLLNTFPAWTCRSDLNAVKAKGTKRNAALIQVRPDLLSFVACCPPVFLVAVTDNWPPIRAYTATTDVASCSGHYSKVGEAEASRHYSCTED